MCECETQKHFVTDALVWLTRCRHLGISHLSNISCGILLLLSTIWLLPFLVPFTNRTQQQWCPSCNLHYENGKFRFFWVNGCKKQYIVFAAFSHNTVGHQAPTLHPGLSVTQWDYDWGKETQTDQSLFVGDGEGVNVSKCQVVHFIVLNAQGFVHLNKVCSALAHCTTFSLISQRNIHGSLRIKWDIFRKWHLWVCGILKSR